MEQRPVAAVEANPHNRGVVDGSWRHIKEGLMDQIQFRYLMRSASFPMALK
jgi:hypothetical protein